MVVSRQVVTREEEIVIMGVINLHGDAMARRDNSLLLELELVQHAASELDWDPQEVINEAKRLMGMRP